MGRRKLDSFTQGKILDALQKLQNELDLNDLPFYGSEVFVAKMQIQRFLKDGSISYLNTTGGDIDRERERELEDKRRDSESIGVTLDADSWDLVEEAIRLGEEELLKVKSFSPVYREAFNTGEKLKAARREIQRTVSGVKQKRNEEREAANNG